MKRRDKYPPPSPEERAHVQAGASTGRMHPLLWVALVVAVLIGMGLYADLVGFYDGGAPQQEHSSARPAGEPEAAAKHADESGD